VAAGATHVIGSIGELPGLLGLERRLPTLQTA
jgi:hypothetical protein